MDRNDCPTTTTSYTKRSRTITLLLWCYCMPHNCDDIVFHTILMLLYATLLCLFCFCLFLGSFLNSCGCSTAKSKTPPHETFFPPLNSTEHGSQKSLTTRDRELVSVLEVRIEPGDLNLRPLTPQSVTLPTIPRAGYAFCHTCHVSLCTTTVLLFFVTLLWCHCMPYYCNVIGCHFIVIIVYATLLRCHCMP